MHRLATAQFVHAVASKVEQLQVGPAGMRLL